MSSTRPDLDALSAEEITTRVRAGDDAVFEAIFARFYEPLRLFAGTYVRSASDGDDLVDELFYTLWRSRESFHLAKTLDTYLYSAVRYRAQNLLRDTRRRAHSVGVFSSEDAAPGMASPPAAPDATLEFQELIERLWAAVDTLPENRRDAIILRWQHQKSFQEIADILGVTVPAAKMLVRRALDTLKDRVPPDLL